MLQSSGEDVIEEVKQIQKGFSYKKSIFTEKWSKKTLVLLLDIGKSLLKFQVFPNLDAT